MQSAETETFRGPKGLHGVGVGARVGVTAGPSFPEMNGVFDAWPVDADALGAVDGELKTGRVAVDDPHPATITTTASAAIQRLTITSHPSRASTFARR